MQGTVLNRDFEQKLGHTRDSFYFQKLTETQQ